MIAFDPTREVGAVAVDARGGRNETILAPVSHEGWGGAGQSLQRCLAAGNFLKPAKCKGRVGAWAGRRGRVPATPAGALNPPPQPS